MKKLYTTTLCFVMAAFTLNAKTIYVSLSGNDSNDGSSWTKALSTPNEAVKKAVSGDEVWIKGGKYVLNGNRFNDTGTAEAGIWLKEGVSIYGGFAGTETSVDMRVRSNPVDEPWNFTNATEFTGGTRIDNGTNGLRLFDRSDKLAIWTNMLYIDGIKISSKVVSSRIGYFKEKVNLRNCALVGCDDNTSVVYFEDGGTIENCLFEDCKNPAYLRSTAKTDERDAIRLINTTFRNNRTLSVSIYNDGSPEFDSPSTIVTDCKFINNDIPYAALAAGKYTSSGIYVNHSQQLRFVNVSGCLFEGNVLRMQGASAIMISGGGTVNVYNNIIRNNSVLKDAAVPANNPSATVISYSIPTITNGVKLFNNLIVNNSSNERSVYTVATNFFNNTVVNNEGLLYFQGATVTYNNIFANNHALNDKAIMQDTPVKLDPGVFAFYDNNANTVPVTLVEELVNNNIALTAGAGFEAPHPSFGSSIQNVESIRNAKYTLSKESMCLNVGTVDNFTVLAYPAEWLTTYFTKDLNGNPRIQNNKLNAGAYQFNLNTDVDNVLKTNSSFVHVVNSQVVINSKFDGRANIFDITGKMVKQVVVNNGETTVNLKSGLYIIRIENGSNNEVFKIIL